MDQFLDASRKRTLFNSILVLIILLAVFVAVLAINGLKENAYIGRDSAVPHTVTVTGKGEVVAIPDTGSFSFSVLEEGKTVAEAQAKASKKINDIIPALKALGVAEKDIKTTNYSSYPKYNYNVPNMCSGGYCRGGNPVLIGYEVNQTVSVKVRKTADAGAALTKVGELGASNISGLDFVIDDMNAVQAQARDKAIADAKSKAEILAKSLGVSLDKIVNFNEENNNPPIYYGLQDKTVGGVSAEAQPPQLPVGENKITSNVSITYEIR